MYRSFHGLFAAATAQLGAPLKNSARPALLRKSHALANAAKTACAGLNLTFIDQRACLLVANLLSSVAFTAGHSGLVMEYSTVSRMRPSPTTI